MTAHVFVTRRIPEVGIDMLLEACSVQVWDDPMPPPRSSLMTEIEVADGILTMLTDKIDAEVMDSAPNLKVISQYAVGYDNIDIAAATERGILVGHTPGVLTNATADLAFALLMAAARRLPESERYVKQGMWQTWHPTLLLGNELNGATLGIVGFGRIGQAVAQRAKGFGMRLIYHGGRNHAAAAELGAAEASLYALLRQSDFVSLHVPYSADTHHLINEETLALMKPTAILINTARGAIVDPKALYQALRNEALAYAALDVTDPEPIEMDDPLLTLDNCLIVPHIGSATVATREKMARMAAENLLAGLRGERLPNCVNPEVYEV